MTRPNWDDADSYGFDPKALSYREYAWQFLRRNPDFQNASKAALELGSEREQQKVATKYGLRDLVSHLHGYELGKPELVWLAETICEPPILPQKGRPNPVHQLRQGEVAIVFDLDATVGTGPAAIDAFLWNARNLLMEERGRYIATLSASERTIRAKTPSIRKSKLFTWLRTYDAVEHMGVAQKEVARVLYPADFEPAEYTQKTKELAAQKRVSDDLKRAKSLVENEYLALVPLDYLQDKSKR
jgi:hypothetical protein